MKNKTVTGVNMHDFFYFAHANLKIVHKVSKILRCRTTLRL